MILFERISVFNARIRPSARTWAAKTTQMRTSLTLDGLAVSGHEKAPTNSLEPQFLRKSLIGVIPHEMWMQEPLGRDPWSGSKVFWAKSNPSAQKKGEKSR